MPKVYSAMNFADALKLATEEERKIILLHESASVDDTLLKALQKDTSDKISLFIGPEGGFDEAEILLARKNHDALIASLGPRRLRAETAAVVAVSLALGI